MTKKERDDLVQLVSLVRLLLEKALHIGENAGQLGIGLEFLDKLKRDILDDLVSISKRKRNEEERKGKGKGNSQKEG